MCFLAPSHCGGFVAGLADKWIASGGDTTTVRKTMSTVGFLGSALSYSLLWALPLATMTPAHGIMLICTAMSLQTFNQSGYGARRWAVTALGRCYALDMTRSICAGFPVSPCRRGMYALVHVACTEPFRLPRHLVLTVGVVACCGVLLTMDVAACCGVLLTNDVVVCCGVVLTMGGLLWRAADKGWSAVACC